MSSASALRERPQRSLRHCGRPPDWQKRLASMGGAQQTGITRGSNVKIAITRSGDIAIPRSGEARTFLSSRVVVAQLS